MCTYKHQFSGIATSARVTVFDIGLSLFPSPSFAPAPHLQGEVTGRVGRDLRRGGDVQARLLVGSAGQSGHHLRAVVEHVRPARLERHAASRQLIAGALASRRIQTLPSRHCRRVRARSSQVTGQSVSQAAVNAVGWTVRHFGYYACGLKLDPVTG